MADKVKVINQFPVLGLLGILLVYFKVTGMITWSWWVVTMPFWIGLAILIAFLLGLGFFAILLALFDR